MTTKLQPTNLDPTLNYSMNQLSANTILDNGVEVLAAANAAFLHANSAFSKANTGTTGGATNARSMINSYVFGN